MIYFKIETLERYVENFATTELHLKAYLLINYGFGETAGSKEKVRRRESNKLI